MNRAVLTVAVAALCVAGSAVAQDRSGGMIGSGTRAENSGQIIGSGSAAGQITGSGAFTMTTQDGYLGNGGLTEDGRQIYGSGTRAEDSGQIIGSGSATGQMMGSGGLTMSTRDQYMGSGGRTEDDGQVLGSGGLIGSGRRADGLSVLELRLVDGSSLLLVISDEGMFVIPIED